MATLNRSARLLSALLFFVHIRLDCGGGGDRTSPFAETAVDYWASGTGSLWVYQRTDH